MWQNVILKLPIVLNCDLKYILNTYKIPPRIRQWKCSREHKRVTGVTSKCSSRHSRQAPG